MALANLGAVDVSGKVAADSRSLSALKQQAKSTPNEALKGAASQFEALFLQTLLKSMRDALPQDGPFASETTKTYTAMFDQQLSQTMAKKGVGIADMLVKQLSPKTLATASGTTAAASDVATPTRSGSARAASMTPTRTATASASATTAGDGTGSVASAARQLANGVSSLPEAARAFLEKMRPHAEAVAQAAGIPASYLLAQAALETGWGRHQPRGSDGTTSFNLFGIKAGTSWKGASTTATTTEVVAGKPVTAQDTFRAYGSYGESFQDFARLIRGNPRYGAVLANTGDAASYARSLQQAGYATDPRYAEKLARTIGTVSRYTSAPAAQVSARQADKSAGSV